MAEESKNYSIISESPKTIFPTLSFGVMIEDNETKKLLQTPSLERGSLSHTPNILDKGSANP